MCLSNKTSIRPAVPHQCSLPNVLWTRGRGGGVDQQGRAAGRSHSRSPRSPPTARPSTSARSTVPGWPCPGRAIGVGAAHPCNMERSRSECVRAMATTANIQTTPIRQSQLTRPTNRRTEGQPCTGVVFATACLGLLGFHCARPPLRCPGAVSGGAIQGVAACLMTF